MKILTSKSIARQTEQELRYRTAIKAELGLKLADLRLLKYLEKQPARQSRAQMQEQLGTNKSRLSESLKRLSNGGFVETSIPAKDHRFIAVEISECGMDALRYAKSIQPRYPISKKEWETLKSALRTTSCNTASTGNAAEGGNHNGLDMRSFHILLALFEKQPNTQTGIAACTHIPQPATSKHLKQLQAKGLVTTASENSASGSTALEASFNNGTSQNNNTRPVAHRPMVHRTMPYHLTNTGGLLLESILSQLK